MLYTVNDEKQTGKYRLLIINNILSKLKNDCIFIDGIKYNTVIVYDLPNAIAIECDENVPSMIGKDVSL